MQKEENIYLYEALALKHLPLKQEKFSEFHYIDAHQLLKHLATPTSPFVILIWLTEYTRNQELEKIEMEVHRFCEVTNLEYEAVVALKQAAGTRFMIRYPQTTEDFSRFIQALRRVQGGWLFQGGCYNAIDDLFYSIH